MTCWNVERLVQRIEYLGSRPGGKVILTFPAFHVLGVGPCVAATPSAAVWIAAQMEFLHASSVPLPQY